MLLVDPLRLAGQVGDDEARVELGLAALVSDHLSFADDAARMWPRAGGVLEVEVDVLGSSGRLAHQAGDDEVEGGVARQNVIAAHRDDVVDLDDLEELEQLRRGEAPVEAHEDAGAREALLQPTDDALEHRQRPARGRCIAGTQRRGAQVLVGLTVERQERQQSADSTSCRKSR